MLMSMLIKKRTNNQFAYLKVENKIKDLLKCY